MEGRDIEAEEPADRQTSLPSCHPGTPSNFAGAQFRFKVLVVEGKEEAVQVLERRVYVQPKISCAVIAVVIDQSDGRC